jgi:serine/threonine-protein kinase
MNSFIRVPLLFLAFVLVGLIFGYATFKALSFSRTVEVPSLYDKTLLEANESLNEAGLYLKIEGEDFDASVASGRIIRQDVPPGRKVKEKRAIKVVISKGPRIDSVPLVVNQSLEDARSILLQKGLEIGKTINVHSDSIEKGKVIAQDPGPDGRLSDFLAVLVSLGPHEATYYCPDFLDKQISSARELAEKMGLVVEIKGVGRIIASQLPKPGALVNNGDKIYFETREDTLRERFF